MFLLILVVEFKIRKIVEIVIISVIIFINFLLIKKHWTILLENGVPV
jgi:energy-converting hydrogenase Eha subunit B